MLDSEPVSLDLSLIDFLPRGEAAAGAAVALAAAAAADDDDDDDALTSLNAAFTLRFLPALIGVVGLLSGPDNVCRKRSNAYNDSV